jgi:propionyl-CoA carboxylase beta chain
LSFVLEKARYATYSVFETVEKATEARKKKVEEYKATVTSAFIAASRGYLDDIILPQNTRWRICKSLSILTNKRVERPWKKHDNLPL